MNKTLSQYVKIACVNINQKRLFIQESRNRYQQIGHVICPVLNQESIYFNSIGFKHLIRKKEKRNLDEQIFRLTLIPYAVPIITQRYVAVTHRMYHVNGKEIHFWGMEKQFKNRTIRVVIRQVGNGRKHLFSIMKNTSKNPA